MTASEGDERCGYRNFLYRRSHPFSYECAISNQPPSPFRLSNQQQMKDFFKKLPTKQNRTFALPNWTQSVHISLTLTAFLPYALHFTLSCLELDALSAWVTLDASLECC